MTKKNREEALKAVKQLLNFLGVTDKEIIKKTPERFLKYLETFQISSDLDQVQNILSTSFSENCCSQIITLHNIKFKSICEHHLLPIIGSVNIAYIPKDKILGVSKMARLVNFVSKKPNLQERMSKEIADHMQEYISPDCLIIVKAQHHCMTLRNIANDDSVMTTIIKRGAFETMSHTDCVSLFS